MSRRQKPQQQYTQYHGTTTGTATKKKQQAKFGQVVGAVVQHTNATAKYINVALQFNPDPKKDDRVVSCKIYFKYNSQAKKPDQLVKALGTVLNQYNINYRVIRNKNNYPAGIEIKDSYKDDSCSKMFRLIIGNNNNNQQLGNGYNKSHNNYHHGNGKHRSHRSSHSRHHNNYNNHNKSYNSNHRPYKSHRPSHSGYNNQKKHDYIDPNHMTNQQLATFIAQHPKTFGDSSDNPPQNPSSQSSYNPALFQQQQYNPEQHQMEGSNNDYNNNYKEPGYGDNDNDNDDDYGSGYKNNG